MEEKPGQSKISDKLHSDFKNQFQRSDSRYHRKIYPHFYWKRKKKGLDVFRSGRILNFFVSVLVSCIHATPRPTHPTHSCSHVLTESATESDTLNCPAEWFLCKVPLIICLGLKVMRNLIWLDMKEIPFSSVMSFHIPLLATRVQMIGKILIDMLINASAIKGFTGRQKWELNLFSEMVFSVCRP